MLDLLDLSFYQMNNDELILRGGNIADLLMVHPAFQSSCIEAAPDSKELKGLAAKLREKVQAANTGHRNWIAERNQAREELITGLTLTGMYVQMMAVRRNDLSILENTGFRLKSRSSTRVVVANRKPEFAPVIKSVKRGTKPGSAIIRAKKHPGKVSYILAMCKGDPGDESSYGIVAHFVNCINELHDLELATKVNFRLQYDINGNLSDWSAPVTYIVT